MAVKMAAEANKMPRIDVSLNGKIQIQLILIDFCYHNQITKLRPCMQVKPILLIQYRIQL